MARITVRTVDGSEFTIINGKSKKEFTSELMRTWGSVNFMLSLDESRDLLIPVEHVTMVRVVE